MIDSRVEEANTLIIQKWELFKLYRSLGTLF